MAVFQTTEKYDDIHFFFNLNLESACGKTVCNMNMIELWKTSAIFVNFFFMYMHTVAHSLFQPAALKKN